MRSPETVLRTDFDAAVSVNHPIKILTVLNGVSGNALGKGTAGAFGACGATLLTLYKGHTREIFNTVYQGISPGGAPTGEQSAENFGSGRAELKGFEVEKLWKQRRYGLKRVLKL